MEKILVTGATGFIGRAVAEKLNERGFIVTASTRNRSADFPSSMLVHFFSGSGGAMDWTSSLVGQDVVVHCAGRAHILMDKNKDPLIAFRAANVDLTLMLASAAAAAKVKRFIFISSIGVNGEATISKPFNESDTPRPLSPYAQSKFEAEMGLWVIAKRTNMDVVIIRPPLVYGPSAPGNFGWLMKMVKMKIPLPFGGLENQRSLISLGNLVDFIAVCANHPNAENQLFLVSDGEDLSTSEILCNLSEALRQRTFTFRIPSLIGKFFMNILGFKKMSKSLYGSLQVDMTKAKKILNWSPPLSIKQGFQEAVRDINSHP